MFLLCAGAAASESKSWISDENGNWTDGKKWFPEGQPQDGDSVGISRNVEVTYSSVTVKLFTLDIDSALGGATLSQTSGGLTTQVTSVGTSHTGTFKQSDGTHTTTLSLDIGNDVSNGSYELSGGTLSTGSTFVSGAGGIFKQSGGTHDITGGQLRLTAASYELSGGVLNTRDIFSEGGAFSQTGGTLTASSSGSLDSIFLGGSGTFTQTGGDLTASSLTVGGGTVFQYSGGTLSANTINNGTFVVNGFRTIAAGSLITGVFMQKSTGQLSIQLRSTSDFDRLTATGRMQLGGRVIVDLPEGFDFPVGSTFDILRARVIDGFNADLFDLPQLPAPKVFRPRLVRSADDTRDIVRLTVAGPVAVTCGDTTALIQAIASPATEIIDLNPHNEGNCTYTLASVFDGSDQDGLPAVSRDLTINGNGAIIERSNAAGTPDFRLFHITANGNLTLNDVIVRNGSQSENGAGLYNDGGVVAISNSTFSNNKGITILNTPGGVMTVTNSTIIDTVGFGIFNFGGLGIFGSDPASLTISNSTILGDAQFGILSVNKGDVTVINSTVTHIEATGQTQTGAGIANAGPGLLTITNSAVVHTGLTGEIIATSSSLDCIGSITSNGHNLDSDGTCGLDPTKGDLPKTDPRFDAFLNPGTPGDGRFPLKPDSPAVDAGANDDCPATDQLGRRRPVDGGQFQGDGIATCDIGAIEQYPNVKLAVHFEPDRSTYDTVQNTGECPSDFPGEFTFTAKLQGESQVIPQLTDLFVQVFMLTNDNLLIGDRGPGGVGTIITVPKQDQYSDGILEKTEFVDVPFMICLKKIEKFNFVVDVYGNVEVQEMAAVSKRGRTD